MTDKIRRGPQHLSKEEDLCTPHKGSRRRISLAVADAAFGTPPRRSRADFPESAGPLMRMLGKLSREYKSSNSCICSVKLPSESIRPEVTMSAPRSTGAQPASTLLSVTEGGIPPQVGYAIQLVAGDEATQSQPSQAIARDARIATVPVEESVAIPEPRPPVENPSYWPSDVRGVPHYRPQEEVDFSTRP